MRLEVITDREAQRRQKLLTYTLCVPPAIGGTVLVIDELRKHGITDELWIWVLLTAFVISVPFLFQWTRRWEVKTFDETGVTLRSGRVFRWDNFVRVDERFRRRMHNHYDLVFTDGVAAVADLWAENFHEVREVIAELQAGRNRFTGVGSKGDGR